MQDPIEQLQQIIDDSTNIVFFGGAGVSTESGLPDFRSSSGLFSRQYQWPAEVMLSHSFFVSHPSEFFQFYKASLFYPDLKPNPAHSKLAELEQSGRLKAVITQNIDGLHQMAGSQKVLELHGSIHRNYCLKCGKTYSSDFIAAAEDVPRCSCGGIVRPDVVLYEEGLDDAVMRESTRLISKADTLIVGGTSLAVYPAAGLLDYFSGRHLVLINHDATALDDAAELVIRSPIGQTMATIRA